MTGWSKRYRKFRAQRSETLGALYEYIVPTSGEHVLITAKDIKDEHGKCDMKDGPEIDAESVYRKGTLIWIADEAVKTKLQIVLEAHCGERGRRAFEITIRTVQKTY